MLSEEYTSNHDKYCKVFNAAKYKRMQHCTILSHDKIHHYILLLSPGFMYSVCCRRLISPSGTKRQQSSARRNSTVQLGSYSEDNLFCTDHIIQAFEFLQRACCVTPRINVGHPLVPLVLSKFCDFYAGSGNGLEFST